MPQPKPCPGIVALWIGALLLPGVAQASAAALDREPCSANDPLRRPFFGDTHVHTAYSFDASSQDTRNTPRDAYRFARGEEVGLQPYDADGKPLRKAKLRRPLDFTVVTDHAEALGEVRICRDPEHPGYGGDFCWMYRTFGPFAFNAMAIRTVVGKQRFAYCGEDDRICLEAAGVVWGDIRDAAEEAYDRSSACRFTSFVGYEWTASAGTGVNLHRNVVFANENVPAYPTSWVETPSAWDLWQHLQRDCIEGTPGCDVLTIPHNSNLSGPGLMFESAKLTGPEDASQPVDAEEARLRQRWEPIVEIMQHKGESECLLGGDTTDEECGFEKLSYNSFAGVGRFRQLNLSQDLAPSRKAMVREALKKGLAIEGLVGANPLKYGIVASTDTHLGTPGLVAEDDSKGHGGAGMQAGLAKGLPDDPEFSPGGLAVVWAEENSRESIFAGMQRREVYGTSGTRPTLRFFGGWGYDDDLCSADDFAARGYAGGVPMGGDLPPRPDGADAPRFAVWALQDAGSAGVPGTPLQRMQIVKGWSDGDATHERVYEVAGGDNGASVDVTTCDRRGDGESQLCSVWSDPDFEPEQRAFYYARVLENPTCRWSQALCVDAGIDCSEPASVPRGFAACCAPDHRPVIQERAWSSPIWYAP
ncbi:MAG: DUF3604 domain-containing protein [Myxococcota bacterium]